jgi:hypothetical protein
MSNFIANGLRSLDFFGVKPKLLINSSPKYKTLIGGSISILVTCLIIAGFIYFGQELIQKQNPTVISSSIFQENPDNYALSPENFNFFIGIQDSNYNYYIDPTILKISITFNNYRSNIVNGTLNWDQTSKELKAEQCDLNKNFPYFKDEFSHQPLSSLYCVDPSTFQNIFIGGNWGQEFFNYLQIRIQTCQNSTDSNVTCKTPEEIDNVLSGGYFVVNLIDSLFEPKNYTNPQKHFRRDTFTTMSNKFYKEVTYYLKNIDYNTDRGVLVEDLSTEKYLQLDYDKELYDFRSNLNGVILDCVFRMSNKKDIYFRKYIKIQDVLAQVGGLIKAIIIVVQILYSNFSQVAYYFHLLENLFVFNENEKQDPDSSNLKANSVYVHPKRLNNSSFSSSIYHSNNNLKVTKTIMERKIDKKKTSAFEGFKLGLCLCFISKNNKRHKVYNKLTNYLEVKSDFKRVLLTQEKLETMKEILLTADQINLFEYYTQKIDLNRNELDRIPDNQSVSKSYETLAAVKQNKLGERLKSLFEKKIL